ncbi:hypothetical protein CRYUN_Cryun02cG0101100 [Craigia yunnanensis]
MDGMNTLVIRNKGSYIVSDKSADKSKLKSRDLKWYFFTTLDKRYGNGSMYNKATERGYRKTTGKDHPIRHRERMVGMKKTLVYHKGRAPWGERINWVILEYCLTDEALEKARIQQDAFVLCRVFQKSGSRPKNGEQYGAPFIEEEWEVGEINDPAIGGENPLPLAGANVMNIILLATECIPWFKTDTIVKKKYKVDGQDMEVSHFQAYIDSVAFVLVDTHMLRHMQNNIYGGNQLDLLNRMVLFCKATVEVPWHAPSGGVCYKDGNIVFIAKDGHTTLLPVYLKAYFGSNSLMSFTRSILVSHNISHQAWSPIDGFYYVDLPKLYTGLFKLYRGEHFNIFSAGLKNTDIMATISHGYAWKLKTSKGDWDLIMPSRFELCRLKDIEHPFNSIEESRLGWIFGNADAIKFIHALGNCLLAYC